ncbi:MAG: DUF4382 domain-containing protein [Sphingobacteriales bacterium]|nr:DUF4382 domain-containing protein [Sphingobacteriales bacterium]
MKNIRTLLTLVVFFFLMLLLIVSCKKETSSQFASATKNKLSVFITGNPVPFQNVFIDIQMVEVKVDTCSTVSNTEIEDDDSGDDDHYEGSGSGHDGDDDRHNGNGSDDSCEVWQTLQVTPGVYDLLKFRNGVDTLLAQGLLPKGKIKAIRLTLGTRNSVVIDSITYPLNLPTNKVVIKIDHAQQIGNGDFKLNLDFDLESSVIRIRDNQFVLDPRIKCFDEGESGRIEGKVAPREAKAIITALGDKDTLMALPGSDDGEFKIRGIRSTKVDLLIDATANGYQDTIIKNISIMQGQKIKLSAINLHK